MNNIYIQNIIPDYFVPKNIDNTEIWNKNSNFGKDEKWIIIAPSGSGKSTLATALLGEHTHYSGTIKYDDVDVKGLHLESIVRYRKQGVSLLFQDVRLIKNLTLKDNIFLRLFDNKKEKYLADLTHYAERLSIEHLLDKKAENCSYGERQRAAILRSLINPTDFLLYDECFSHLDLENKEIAFQLIDEVATANKSSVIFFELNDFPFHHNYKKLHL